jgi:hypothetical protein
LDGAFRLDTGWCPCRLHFQHYELEQEAIFRKTWLNVGRVEQLPKNGSYFAKELDAATRRSCSRDMEGEVRRSTAWPPPRQQAGVERLPR